MRVARLLKITGVVVGLLVIAAAGIGIYVYHSMHSDPFMPLYAENCAVCHGAAFEGAAQGPPLVGRALSHGESVADISRSIAAGIPERGMPGWSGLLGEGQIQSLAILIAEQRVDRRFTDFKTDMALMLPVDPVETRLATFRVETVVEGIAPKPFFGSGITNGSTRK